MLVPNYGQQEGTAQGQTKHRFTLHSLDLYNTTGPIAHFCAFPEIGNLAPPQQIGINTNLHFDIKKRHPPLAVINIDTNWYLRKWSS